LVRVTSRPCSNRWSATRYAAALWKPLKPT